MLFQSKRKKNTVMLSYGAVTGLVIGANEISVEGKTYRLFTNPIHLNDDPKPLDVSVYAGGVIKVAGSVGADTVYEAKIVEL
jgi:hypothetical protein